MKVMVIGSSGALGSDCVRVFGEDGVGVTRPECDLTKPDSVKDCLDKIQPSHVINTAAFHQVPLCETEMEQAFAVNTIAVKHLAKACQERQAHLCHISTDYVFKGSEHQPHREEDPTCPESIYAISKLAGEHVVQAYCDDYAIIRTCGLYGRIPTRAKGGNFVTTMVRLGRTRDEITVVNDEYVAPTYTFDLAKGIQNLFKSQGKGVFHITQSGEPTWFDMAQLIFKTMKIDVTCKPVSASQFQSVVKRPSYSILCNKKFMEQTNQPLRSWDAALVDYLTNDFVPVSES